MHAGLVIGVGGESLGLLRRHRGVALDQGRHHATRRLQPEGERRHVQEQELRELLALRIPAEDRGLHRRTEGHRLVGVNALARLLAAEVVAEQALDLRDARRPAHEHDLVHLPLGHLRVADDLVDRLHGLAEVVHVHVLEAGPSDGGVEVDAFEEGVDLDVRLRGGRKRTLCALARRAKAAQGALVLPNVLFELALELLEEVVHHAVIEILAAEVGVAGGRFTSKMPSSMVRSETSNVPPPRSKMSTFFSSPFLSSPYAIAAAVGSLMMRSTLSPAIEPASFVAWRCES